MVKGDTALRVTVMVAAPPFSFTLYTPVLNCTVGVLSIMFTTVGLGVPRLALTGLLRLILNVSLGSTIAS